MKKLTALLLGTAMVLCLAACGGSRFFQRSRFFRGCLLL